VDTKEVIFIADDFGLSSEVNRAILRAHREGVLDGASLMMGQPATEEAIAMAQENSTLQVGWHLHLCHSQPMTIPAWPWGYSPNRAGIMIGLTWWGYRLMQQEVRAQWNVFKASGLPARFVNTHHHLHVHPFIYRTMRQVLAPSFNGWMRMGTVRWFSPANGSRLVSRASTWLHERRDRRGPFRLSDTLWGVDRLYGMQAAEVATEIPRLPAGLHEFMFHPRTLEHDADLQCLIDLKKLLVR
jgi:predicted glycoside hydrolase/deacetylase ChbG (UPF0249 family)